MQNRQYNLVLYGLPIQHEDQFNPYPLVERVFESLQVPAAEIRDAVVIRRYNLVKVTLYSLRYRRHLLTEAARLRKRPGHFSKVFINPDLTYDERRRDKALRDLVKDTARANPDCKVFIKDKTVLLRKSDGSITDVPLSTRHVNSGHSTSDLRASGLNSLLDNSMDTTEFSKKVNTKRGGSRNASMSAGNNLN